MSSVWVMATQTDSARIDHLSLGRMVDKDAMANPALHGKMYATSYSQIALAWDYRHQTEAIVEEKGDGFSLPSIGVDTYLHLSDKTAVWGTASYLSGRKRNIVWNSTSDYDLLQPYVLADTLGGDTRLERYAFSGGYASETHHWLLGAEMLFRAEQEYRDQDPRMRGVVTDLTLRLGAGRDICAYRLGAAVEANIYKQMNTVEFYNEEGVIPEYQMTGLGTEYARFSGDKRSIYYEGGGMALLLHLSPLHSRGFYADLSLDEHRYHRKLADYNSMPLTDLYCEHVGATIGWKRQTEKKTALFAQVDYTKRTGDEHVGGTSDARYFPTIACLTLYKNHLLDAALGALYGHDHWHVALRAGYWSHTEEYVYPHRQLDYQSAFGELRGQLFIPTSSPWSLKVDAHAAYVGHLDDTVTMPYANMDGKITRMVDHKVTFAKANYTDLGASVRGDYTWGHTRYGLFAELGGGMVMCSASARQYDVHLSVGITF